MREVEAARARLEFYHATSARLASMPAKIALALAKMADITRPLLREASEVDIAVIKVNASLPPGGARLSSVEACRRGDTPEPVFRELRRGWYFVEGGSGRILGAEKQSAASPRPDGKYDVTIGGGTTGGSWCTVASLAEFAEVELTEHPSRGLPEQLAIAIRIPGMTLADAPGWDCPTDRTAPAFPDDVINRLDELENRAPAAPLPPRVSTKLIPVSKWDAEQTPAASKAA